MGSLEAYKNKLNRRSENSLENIFQSKVNMWSHKSKDRWNKLQENSTNKENQDKMSKYHLCGICKRKSHLDKNFWFEGKPQCRVCRKFGHAENNFRSRKAHQANFTEKKNMKNYIFLCQSNWK